MQTGPFDRGRSEGPRSVAQILDGALRLYLGSFVSMFSVALAGALVAWVLLFTGRPVPLSVPPQVRLPGFLRAVFAQAAGIAPPWWASLLTAFAGLLFATTLLVLAGRAADRPGAPAPAFLDAVRAGLGRLWPYLVTSFVVTAAGGLAALFLVAPGVFLLTRWSVAPVAAVVDGRRATEALGRSYALVRGLFWHTLGAILLGLLALSVVRWALLLPLFLPVPGEAGLFLRALWAELAGALVTPYVACLFVTLYRDLCARKEGADLLPPGPGGWVPE